MTAEGQGEGDSRPLWGVPLAPDDFVQNPALVERLDRWLSGSSLLLVDAPSGYGKTSVIAAWLRSQESGLPVVWISCGEWIQSREAVWATLITALVEIGLLPVGTSMIYGDAATFAALQGMGRPVIVVYDDLDEAGESPDLDRLVRIARQVPLVRSVVIVSSTEDDGIGDTVDRVIVESSALAWDAAMVKAAADAVYGAAARRIAPAAVAAATNGRAAAVLHYLAVAVPELGERGAGALRPPREIALAWSLKNLRRRENGDDALTALLTVALAIRMPAALLASLMPRAPIDDLVTLLVHEGLLRAHRGADRLPVYEVRVQERELLEAHAMVLLGETIETVHDRAAEFHTGRNPALAIHHLARAGRVREALEMMKGVWREVGREVPVVDFRLAIAAIPDAEYRRDLEALAVRVLLARLPPLDPLRRRDLETHLLTSLASRVRSIPPARRILVVAAAIWALLSRDRVRDALVMATDFTQQLPADGSLGEATAELSVLWNLTAESYLLAGQPSQALTYLRRARDLAATGGTSFVRFRTVSMAALARALGGDFPLAAELVIQARSIYAAESRPRSPIEYPLALAEGLIAHSRLDAPAMMRVAAWFTRFADDDRRWRVAANVSEAYSLLFSGQAEAGLAALGQVLHGAGSVGVSPMADALGAGLQADLLIARGRPGRAIEVLADAVSPPGHATCVACQKASALLAIGQPRLALRETELCIEMGSEHSLRTLPAVLFRRAIAHEQLGRQAAADESFLDAFLIVRGTPVLAPYLNLSQTTLRLLFRRLAANRPEYADDVKSAWREVDGMTQLLLPDQVTSALSEREIRVLALIATGQTVSEMATALFVSPNTVKTQISSIYRKLGVSSRLEAADIAATMGLTTEP